MEVKANLKYLRIAPRKVRLLADLIRGKKIERARTLLKFSLKRGSQPLIKLLEGAVANARHNFQLEEKGLWISEIKVDEGPKLKRWRARARGRAAEIQKKTCHVSLILSGAKKRRAAEPEEKKMTEKKEIPEEKPKIKAEAPKPEREIVSFKAPGARKRIFRRKAF